MKLVSGLVGLLSVTNALADITAEWASWKSEHGFSFNAVEEPTRFKHWLSTKDFVKNHNEKFNNGEVRFTVSMNKFSAMPNEEFKELYLMKEVEREIVNDQVVSEYQCPTKYSSKKGGAPSSYSWRDHRAVTIVKDQGSCGSCWTFGAGAAIEGAMCKKGNYNCNTWNGVSAQQFVDCASSNRDLSPYDNSGCDGGFQSNAMRYVWTIPKGVDSWDNYPYTGKEQSCNYRSSNSVGTIKSCGRLGHAGDEDLMVDMVYHEGVTTVAIDASGREFQQYSGGVYHSTSCSSSRLNHAVTMTGYGGSGSGKYFEVKNSWGTGWGLSGFINFERAGKNMCGVATEGQYAIL